MSLQERAMVRSRIQGSSQHNGNVYRDYLEMGIIDLSEVYW